ncbi:MAG: methylglyoxal synthase [Mollicutes bacterium]|nr:methylglyoxal synthase [Mollicutes bacterium]MDD7263909.1 methylglyoxal synthase [bacterium]MDY4979562.1 methylglyoxal synthase [Candidatus Onthovivens sp.]
MKIALIAHDKKKESMIILAKRYADVLKEHDLYATGTTGRLISLSTGLNITCMKSGPLGGDQQIGSLIAEDLLDIVIFLRDPLTAQPHEPDVNALLRLCDVTKTIVATNINTAVIILNALKNNEITITKSIS